MPLLGLVMAGSSDQPLDDALMIVKHGEVAPAAVAGFSESWSPPAVQFFGDDT